MRKWTVLMAVFLMVMVTGPAQAFDISMTNKSPQYWGNLTVDFGDRDDWVVGAGRFYTTIHDDEKQIDTFSYCVDLGQFFSWNTIYTADVIQPNDLYRYAAWLVSQFDPFTGKQYQGQSVTDGDAKSIAMTLQLAIWGTLYGDDFSPVAGGDMALLATMQDSLGSIGSFDPGGFFVAVIDGQDQLVAAPVPEPATMLLMGIGLLGLGVVGRKRLK